MEEPWNSIIVIILSLRSGVRLLEFNISKTWKKKIVSELFWKTLTQVSKHFKRKTKKASNRWKRQSDGSSR